MVLDWPRIKCSKTFPFTWFKNIQPLFTQIFWKKKTKKQSEFWCWKLL